MRFLCTLLLLVGLTACSPVGVPSGSSSQNAEEIASDGTVFAGPYAAEFVGIYDSYDDPVIRRVLVDEAITVEELQVVKETFVTCLTDLGFTEVVVMNNGAMDLAHPPELNHESDLVYELVERCEKSTGWADISFLTTMIEGNPENRDTSTLMAECLVRTGAQPPGYSANDYLRDSEDGTIGRLVESNPVLREKYISCSQNPAYAS